LGDTRRGEKGISREIREPTISLVDAKGNNKNSLCETKGQGDCGTSGEKRGIGKER